MSYGFRQYVQADTDTGCTAASVDREDRYNPQQTGLLRGQFPVVSLPFPLNQSTNELFNSPFLGSRPCFQLNEPNEPNEPNELNELNKLYRLSSSVSIRVHPWLVM